MNKKQAVIPIFRLGSLYLTENLTYLTEECIFMVPTIFTMEMYLYEIM